MYLYMSRWYVARACIYAGRQTAYISLMLLAFRWSSSFSAVLMGNSLFPSRRFIIIDAVFVKLPRSFSRLKLTPISVGPIYPRSWRNLPQRVTNFRKRFYIYSFFAFWLVSPAPCAFILQLKTSCKISMEDMGSNKSLFLKPMFFWRKIKW